MRALMIGSLFPPHDHGGGYELVWHAAVAAARAAGHDVRVLCSDHRGAGPHDGEQDVHRTLRWYWDDHAFPRRSPREVVAMERHNARVVRAHLDGFAPDVVAFWSMGGMSLTALEVVRRAGVPAAAFVHDDWLDYGRRVDRWTHWSSRRPRAARAVGRIAGIPGPVSFDAVHHAFVSRTTRDHAWLAGVPLGSTSIANSGIDPAYVDPAPPQPWSWSLLSVGRIDPRKGIATAIDALPLLPPEAVLTVVGDGPEREADALRARARALGVEERVRLVGGRSRAALPEFYAAADAVVFPVLWEEPWGLVPLEAMACGRPAVATGRGGSSEYLRDGENALLFPAGDAAALADRLHRLAADPDLRARLREGGVATAREHTEVQFNAAVLETLAAVAAKRPAAATWAGGGGPALSVVTPREGAVPLAVRLAALDVQCGDDVELLTGDGAEARGARVLLVGGDVVPHRRLIAEHRAAHERLGDPDAGVLGRVVPGRGRTAFAHWLARQRLTEAPYTGANVSLPAAAFALVRDLRPGCLTDLEAGHRLLLAGVRLHVAPRARVTRPATATTEEAKRLVAGLARSERAFLQTRPHLAPRLHARFAHAAAAGPARGRLRALVRVVPPRMPVLGPRVWDTTTRHHVQTLTPAFLKAWEELPQPAADSV